MAEDDGKPNVEWEELHESTSFRDVFRYRKDGRERAYKLRVLGDHAELWVVSEENSKEMKSRKLVTFTNSDDVRPFLESIEHELRAGGWLEA